MVAFGQKREATCYSLFPGPNHEYKVFPIWVVDKGGVFSNKVVEKVSVADRNKWLKLFNQRQEFRYNEWRDYYRRKPDDISLYYSESYDSSVTGLLERLKIEQHFIFLNTGLVDDESLILIPKGVDEEIKNSVLNYKPLDYLPYAEQTNEDLNIYIMERHLTSDHSTRSC